MEVFAYKVIFTGTKEQAFALEKLLRPKADIGWNRAMGGLQFGVYSPMTGRKHSPETIAKIKLSNMGKNKGRISPRKGVIVTNETREKIRIASSQRRHRPESKIKVSEALRNRVRKQETFDKISKSAKARYDKERSDFYSWLATHGNYIGNIETMSRKDAEKENIG